MCKDCVSIFNVFKEMYLDNFQSSDPGCEKRQDWCICIIFRRCLLTQLLNPTIYIVFKTVIGYCWTSQLFIKSACGFCPLARFSPHESLIKCYSYSNAYWFYIKIHRKTLITQHFYMLNILLIYALNIFLTH